jgi:nucleotide-binding universal stress UspA family protein
MARIRRVMVASDFSPASRAAFARAVELAKANRARLLVMHALTLVPPML